MNKTRFADALTVIFLALTVYHCQQVLSHFEKEPILSWSMAIGLDLGTAFAAFVATDRAVKSGMARWLSGLWLVGLLAVGYGLNSAFYLASGGGVWAWFLAAIFPVSVALLGAIKPGLSVGSQPVADVVDQSPPATQPIDVEELLSRMQAEISRQLATALAELPALVRREVGQAMYPSPEAGAADSGGYDTLDLSDLLAETEELVAVAGVATTEAGESPKAAARRLRAEGMSYQQIAGRLGVNPSTVGRWLSK